MKGCSSLKPSHLYFANDLMLFCKRDVKSAYILLQGLKLFSKTSGLQANHNKSALYCSGVCEADIQRIMHFSRFKFEQLSFRYLGAPISNKKISMSDCEALVEKKWQWKLELGVLETYL